MVVSGSSPCVPDISQPASLRMECADLRLEKRKMERCSLFPTLTSPESTESSSSKTDERLQKWRKL